MTKKFSVIVGLCLFMFGFSSEAFAYRISVAGWRGGSYNKKDGRFSHCVVSAKYRRGDRLLFSINSKYIFSIGIADNRWNLRKGARYPVRLQVDRRRPFERTAIAVSSRQLVIVINDRVTFFRMVKRGRRLFIDANGLERGYKLTGTSRALNATLRCVKEKLRYADYDQPNDDSYTRGTKRTQPRAYNDQPRTQPRRRVTKPDQFGSGNTRSNDFGTDESVTTKPRRYANLPPTKKLPPVRRARKKNALSDQRVLINTINMLSEAGVSGYKILEKNPFKEEGFQVAWRYGKGKRGAIATFGGKKSSFIDTQTSTILADDAKTCKGKFASGFRKSDATSKWSGRRLFTVCSNSSDGNDFTINYSIGVNPSGVATIVATIIGAGADVGNDEFEQIDQAIYQTKVFRNIGK